MIDNVDIVCGLSWGDEAKGKVVSNLVTINQYDWVCRWSGGSNAGHTIYKNNTRYITHLVPSGIFHNINCYIGPECYLNINEFESELEYLSNFGLDTNLIFISPNTHLVTNEHILDDKRLYTNSQGSTGKGIAPCARDKFARIGVKIKDSPELSKLLKYNPNMLLDKTKLSGNIMCEGAQGFWLDINFGNYPYVTSSLTLPYSSCSLGFPPQKIRDIYGCAKMYDTRVGVDTEFPDTILELAELGKEIGSTTGRLRKAQWLNLDKLIYAINISGTTHLIISKVDIIKQINKFKMIRNNCLFKFENIYEFKEEIEKNITQNCSLIKNIVFSESPFKI